MSERLADDHAPMEAVGGYIECSCGWWEPPDDYPDGFVGHIEALVRKELDDEDDDDT